MMNLRLSGLLAVIVLVAGVLAGCASPTSAPNPARAPGSHPKSGSALQDAHVRPGLVLSVVVVVAGKKEIDEPTKRVSDQGDVGLPLLGLVQVNGLTLAELTTLLTSQYKEYFVDPQIMVDFPKDGSGDGVSPWGYVTVLGRVKRPGRVNLPPTRDMTVSQAVQQAGGLDTSARDSAIRLTRKTADGKSQVREINLKAVGSRGQVTEDAVLQADDVIFVPEAIF